MSYLGYESEEQYHEKRKELDDLNIFISTHLFNKPCVGYWWYDSDGGYPEINFREGDSNWRDEKWKEPLYAVTDTNDSFFFVEQTYEQLLKRFERYFNQESSVESAKEKWEEDHLFGHNRHNLHLIPNYSRDLNLIQECEQKLVEMDLDNMYLTKLCNELFESGKTEFRQFNLFLMTPEQKARCIVKTLKEHLNVK